MIVYYKLFDMLMRRNMKPSALLAVISSPTLGKLRRNEIVRTDVLYRVCRFLRCQPGDIMEVI